MDLLNQHVQAGRLDISEYDERCRRAVNARVHSELAELFLDLPRIPNKKGQTPMVPSEPVPGYSKQLYSAVEIEALRREGQRKKTGAMTLTVIGAITATAVTDLAIFMVLIPVVAVLLYILKLGPASWHTPGALELERRREQLNRGR